MRTKPRRVLYTACKTLWRPQKGTKPPYFQTLYTISTAPTKREWINQIYKASKGRYSVYNNNNYMDTIHLVKAVKTGNGLTVNIPADFLRALNIRRGDYLVMAIYSGDTFLTRKPTEQELLQLKPKQIEYGN